MFGEEIQVWLRGVTQVRRSCFIAIQGLFLHILDSYPELEISEEALKVENTMLQILPSGPI